MTARAGQQIIELGDITERTWHEIPGDFSDAVSLIVSIWIPSFEPETARVLWAVSDSINDGKRWWSLEDTGGLHNGRLCEIGAAQPQFSETRRFIVPFGPKLAVHLMTGHYPHAGVDQAAPVLFKNVEVSLFWRTL